MQACITQRGVYMPARRLDALGLQSPSGNVRGVTIPHNINLSKGLQSPWTVPRTCMEYIFTINNVSLWPESDH